MLWGHLFTASGEDGVDLWDTGRKANAKSSQAEVGAERSGRLTSVLYRGICMTRCSTVFQRKFELSEIKASREIPVYSALSRQGFRDRITATTTSHTRVLMLIIGAAVTIIAHATLDKDQGILILMREMGEGVGSEGTNHITDSARTLCRHNSGRLTIRCSEVTTEASRKAPAFVHF